MPRLCAPIIGTDNHNRGTKTFIPLGGTLVIQSSSNPLAVSCPDCPDCPNYSETLWPLSRRPTRFLAGLPSENVAHPRAEDRFSGGISRGRQVVGSGARVFRPPGRLRPSPRSPPPGGLSSPTERRPGAFGTEPSPAHGPGACLARQNARAPWLRSESGARSCLPIPCQFLRSSAPDPAAWPA